MHLVKNKTNHNDCELCDLSSNNKLCIRSKCDEGYYYKKHKPLILIRQRMKRIKNYQRRL